jgi:hypothetical protein
LFIGWRPLSESKFGRLLPHTDQELAEIVPLNGILGIQSQSIGKSRPSIIKPVRPFISKQAARLQSGSPH